MTELTQNDTIQRPGPSPRHSGAEIREFRQVAHEAWEKGLLATWGHAEGHRVCAKRPDAVNLGMIADTMGMTGYSASYLWMIAHGTRRQAAGGPIIPVEKKEQENEMPMR